jgi:competence protein ComEC
MPGAVVKVPAIPTVSFALMIGGGLWLLLWSRPWRVLGLVAIAAGLFAAPFERRPDLYVGRDGTTVAVRGADGRLSALASRGSAFDLARWLELDGDRTPPADAAASSAFACDRIGCTARSRGRLIVVAMSPAALRDDCLRADVLIVRFASADPCPRAQRSGQLLITPAHLARAGAHAVELTSTEIRLDTVADRRGRRPWSGPLVERIPPDDERPAPGRIAGFTSLFERFRAPRPEIEDEHWPRGRPADENP